MSLPTYDQTYIHTHSPNTTIIEVVIMVMEVDDSGDDTGWGAKGNLPRSLIDVILKRPPSYVVVVMFVLPKFVLLFRRSRFCVNARTRGFQMSTQALCLVVIPMRPVGET